MIIFNLKFTQAQILQRIHSKGQKSLGNSNSRPHKSRVLNFICNSHVNPVCTQKNIVSVLTFLLSTRDTMFFLAAFLCNFFLQKLSFVWFLLALTQFCFTISPWSAYENVWPVIMSSPFWSLAPYMQLLWYVVSHDSKAMKSIRAANKVSRTSQGPH